MKIYNKLIRDQIPSIIEENGRVAITEILADDQFLVEATKKLYEEVQEFEEAIEEEDRLEELADVMELLYTIAHIYDCSPSQLEEIRQKKALERGGFTKGIFLKEVRDR